MPSLLESNLSEDYHVFTNENYWLQQLGLGSFTTGTLYDFWYEVDPQTGAKDLNRRLFPGADMHDSPGPAILMENLPSPIDSYAWQASMDVWRFVDAGRGKYEYIPDLRDWTFDDANKQQLDHYTLPFEFEDLKLEEFLDVNYIPPTSIAVEDTGTLVSIVRPSRLLGPVADEDGNEEVPKDAGLGYASAIVAMNEYMKYYMFKKPDKSEWDTQHLARLEFLDDIKTSKSGCLNISVHLYVDIAPGQLDKNGQVCVKDEPLTHNLFLFDEHQQSSNTKTAIMAVTKHAGARRDTTGRVYGNRDNGEMENVNEKDPSQEVVGDIDLHYNEYTKTWQSGSKAILAKLTTNIPKAQWISEEEDAIELIEEINISDVLDNPDGKEFFVMGSGLAMPIVMQNGNPFQWSPNYATTKDCRSEDNKEKAKVQVFNPDDNRSFTKNQTVMLHQIDGLWMPLEFGSGAQDAKFLPPSIFLGRWDFQYLAIPQPYFFYGYRSNAEDFAEDGDLAEPRYITSSYTRFNPTQAEKSFHFQYYNDSRTGGLSNGVSEEDRDLNTAGDNDPVKYSQGISTSNSVQLPHWYHQFSSFDYMDRFVGGTRGDKRGILGTVFGETPARSPIEDQINNLSSQYFGCTFPNGYDTSRSSEVHTGRDFRITPFQHNNEIVQEGNAYGGDGGIFAVPVGKGNELMFADGGQDSDGNWDRSAPLEGPQEDLDGDGEDEARPTPLFAGYTKGDLTLNHLPADIATHCSPSGLYGRPIFDAGYLGLLHDALLGQYSVADKMRKFFFSSGIHLSTEQKDNAFGHGHRVWMFKAPVQDSSSSVDQGEYNDSIMNSAFDFQPIQQNKIQFRPLKSEVYASMGGPLTGTVATSILDANNDKHTLYNIVRYKNTDAKPTMSESSVKRSQADWERLGEFRGENFASAVDQDGDPAFIPGYHFSIHDHQTDDAGRANPVNGVGKGSIPLAWDWTCNMLDTIFNRSQRILGHMLRRAEDAWGRTCGGSAVGQGVAGVIGAVCTIQASQRVEFHTDQLLGLPSYYRSADNKFVPQWGGNSKDYTSWNTTDLHVRVYQAHPREDLIYDPRTFAVHHFNPGTNLPIERTATASTNSSINGIPKTFGDPVATVQFADTDGDGKPDCWVDYPSTSVDIRIPTYVNTQALAQVQLRWQDENTDNHPNVAGTDTNLQGKEIPAGTVVMSNGIKKSESGNDWQTLLKPEFWNVDPKRRGKLLPYNYKRSAVNINTDVKISEGAKEGVLYVANSELQHPEVSMPALPEDGVAAYEVDAVITGFGKEYLVGDTFNVKGAEGAVITVTKVSEEDENKGAVISWEFTSLPTTGINPTFLLGSGAMCKENTRGGASTTPLNAFGKGFNVYFPRGIMAQGRVVTDPKPKIASSSDAYQLSLPADNSKARDGAAGGVIGAGGGLGGLITGGLANFFFGTNEWGGAGGGAIEPSQGTQQTDVDILPQNAHEEGKYDCFFHFHNDLSHTWMFADYAHQCRLTDNYIDLRINPI